MTVAFVYTLHVDRSSRLVRPGITSDVYHYNVITISLFPLGKGNGWALLMTPGITFGAGTLMMH
jgi:hypothetical protein